MIPESFLIWVFGCVSDAILKYFVQPTATENSCFFENMEPESGMITVENSRL